MKDAAVCGRWLSLAVVAVLLLSAPQPAAGVTPTEELKGTVERIVKILQDPALKGKARRASIREVVIEVFDFAETGKRALGRHWQDRTEKERGEFVGLFTDLVEHAYISRIDVFGGPESVRYETEQVSADLAAVPTTLTTKHGKRVAVDYRMYRRGDRWRVYDLVIEGVSLIANYRAQFSKILRAGSYAALVEKLKARHEEVLGKEGEG